MRVDLQKLNPLPFISETAKNAYNHTISPALDAIKNVGSSVAGAASKKWNNLTDQVKTALLKPDSDQKFTWNNLKPVVKTALKVTAIALLFLAVGALVAASILSGGAALPVTGVFAPALFVAACYLTGKTIGEHLKNTPVKAEIRTGSPNPNSANIAPRVNP